MKKSITQTNGHLLSVLKEKLKLLVVAAVFVTGGVQAADKHAQGSIDWLTGTWYDAATGGNPVTAPTAGDNVFTNGYAITITDDVTCDNLTFTNVAGQIGIAAGKTLTVRGKMDCAVAGTADAFSTSDATSILKLTGAAITTTSPYILITDFAIPGIRVKNMVIEAADLKTYQIGVSTNQSYTHGTGKFTVKAGTKLDSRSYLLLGLGIDNELVIEEGATVTSYLNIRGSSGNLYTRLTKATINGILTAKAGFSVKDLTLGSNGVLKTENSPASNTGFVTSEGWWTYANTSLDATKFGTPNSVTLGSNSTIEFSKANAQNINGIVLANGSTPTTAYSIAYVNLKLSGSGTKTIQSNLTATGNLTIARGVTMATAPSVTATVNGVVLNFGTITGTLTNAQTINVSSADLAKGTVAGSISGTNVSLTATAITGYVFVNWTEGGNPVSTDAAYAFTSSGNKNLVANFDVDTNINAIEIYNAQGKQIQKLSKVNHVYGLTTGIYIVKMYGIQGVTVQKVCVK